MRRVKLSRVCLCVLAAAVVFAAAAYAVTTYKVHDMNRERPPVVDPPQRFGQPPSDAIILFGPEKSDSEQEALAAWEKTNGRDATWKVEDDYMEVRGGTIRTRQQFGNCQLHVEWRSPQGVPPNVTGQKRSNSGVFLMDRYEVQVLDSYTDDNYRTNRTYADGQAASLYGQHPPMVNVCRPPGEWQTYDIAFMRPLFDEKGNCIRKARITLWHNGVCVHNNLEIEGTTFHKRPAKYQSPHEKGHIALQDHGDKVRYRNIWVRRLPEEPYLIQQ